LCGLPTLRLNYDIMRDVKAMFSAFARAAALSATALCAGYAGAIGEPVSPGVAPGPQTGAMYATDAYPGFDRESEIVSPQRKEPRWFSFLVGPNRDNPADQMAHCEELIRDGSIRRARRQLDALVRKWPTSPEAPKAQEMLAELILDKFDDAEDAFAEYRYLVDFHSLKCDYAKTADKLYAIANLMRERGKEIMFVRFANTVDVRRAYEACVMRAPGASWAPQAMLTIAALREDEGKFEEAAKVYENLRNIHPGTDEAKTAVLREAEVRMKLLRELEYNRYRRQDTVDYLKLALRTCRPADSGRIQALLDEAEAGTAEAAWTRARFYDSPTRTKRSAIAAYEKFLDENPDSVHAAEARARLSELKGGGK